MGSITPLPADASTWNETRKRQALVERRQRLAEIENMRAGDLGDAEIAEIHQIMDDVDRLTGRDTRALAGRDIVTGRDVPALPIHPVGSSNRTTVEQSGPFLSLEQKVAPYFGGTSSKWGSSNFAHSRGERVRLGALIAAMAGGSQLYSQLNGVEMRALTESTGPAGGYLVPEYISAEFIDEVRPLARVVEAGARSLPMAGPVVKLPGWDTAPTASWRGEGDSFSDAGGTFRDVKLTAKMVAAEFKVSIELLEDTGQGSLEAVSRIIEDTAARAIAQAIDKAALVGKGTDNEPLGLQNVTGINEVSLGANGAVPTDYDKFLDAVYEVENDNFEPGAILYSARTANTLRKLATGIASDKTKLQVPERLRELRRLITNQMGNALTQGSDTASSSAYVGDWSQMVIGFRPDLGIRVQTDPYTKGSTGEVLLRANTRVDVALLQKSAFCRLVGIKA